MSLLFGNPRQAMCAELPQLAETAPLAIPLARFGKIVRTASRSLDRKRPDDQALRRGFGGESSRSESNRGCYGHCQRDGYQRDRPSCR